MYILYILNIYIIYLYNNCIIMKIIIIIIEEIQKLEC